MPIYPPQMPDWMVIGPIPVVNGTPTDDDIAKGLSLCDQAYYGLLRNQPGAMETRIRASMYLYELQTARFNASTPNLSILERISDELQDLRGLINAILEVMGNHWGLTAFNFNTVAAFQQKMNNYIQRNEWVPVVNGVGSYPENKNLPKISCPGDIEAMSQQVVIQYLKFYELNTTIGADGLGGLKTILRNFLTTTTHEDRPENYEA